MYLFKGSKTCTCSVYGWSESQRGLFVALYSHHPVSDDTTIDLGIFQVSYSL